MKTIRLFSLFTVFFAALGLSSCSGDLEPVDPTLIVNNPGEGGGSGGGTGGGGSTSGTFKVDIDGTSYTASTTMVYITGGAIQISAIRSQGDSFAFLLGGTTPGTYPANADNNLVSYTQAGQEYGWWGFNPDDETADTGSVIVTSVDQTNHTISGTFSYTGYWSDEDNASPPGPKHFTNGVFTNLPYVTSSPTNDVFLAKVDGADYNQNNLLTITADIAGQEFISIGTENAIGQSMTVSVRSNVGPGTYPITGNVSTDKAQIDFGNDDGDEIATSGQVIVTEKTSTRIKGTFTGSVVISGTTHNITAGSFDVEY